MKKFGLFITKIILLSFVLFSAACTTAPPSIQTGPDAEVSFDGLHVVDHSQADLAWARPDFDISGYTKIMPVSAGFEYTPAKNRGRTQMERNRGGPYFMDDDARVRFETLVGEIFREELAKIEHYTFATEPGPDVMIVKGGLLKITSYVPPETTGRSDVYLSQIGQATLVLELRDSETGTILARSTAERQKEWVARSRNPIG